MIVFVRAAGKKGMLDPYIRERTLDRLRTALLAGSRMCGDVVLSDGGFHFADALHLASASAAGAQSVATFDEDFRLLADKLAIAVGVIAP